MDQINRKTAYAMAAAFILAAAPPIQAMLASNQIDGPRTVITVLIAAAISGIVGATNKLIESLEE